MSNSTTATVAPVGVTHATIAMRVLVAVPLAVSAWLHYDLAAGPMAAGGKLTLAGLFIGQAIVAGLITLWVLVRGDRLSLLAAAVVAIASFGALILTTYLKVPSIGPLPGVYDPSWYSDKTIAALSAGLAGLAALAALLRVRRPS